MNYIVGIHIILIELYNVSKGIRIVIENIYFFKRPVSFSALKRL